MTRLLRSIQFSFFLAALFSINLTIAQQVQLGKNFTLSLGDENQKDISPEMKELLHKFEKQIYFTQNQGQFKPEVKYRADFPLGQAVATNEGMMISTFDAATMNSRQEEGEKIEQDIKEGRAWHPISGGLKGHTWMMDFVNHSPLMSIDGQQKHSDTYNYFTNSVSLKSISNYGEIWYNHVYDNVDVRYYPSEEGTLEYDIVCKPGFENKNIVLKMDGINKISLLDNGHLILHTSVGDVDFPAPVAYQMENGKERPVSVKYVLSGNEIRFELGNYDATKTLIIDPIALRWATWVNTNSSGDNHGHCIWVDQSTGYIYVVARVVGTTDQITAGAFDVSANGNLETIIGKYAEPAAVGGSGTRVWQTYIGGSGDENPYALEQGPDGNLYITGYTSSTDFPIIGGTAFNGGGASIDNRGQTTDNIFIMKITQDGQSIKASVIGGNGDDGAFDLRINNSGDIVICGNTQSTNLLTLFAGSGATNSNAGNIDGIVLKINQDLSAVSWIKNFGGSGIDQPTIMVQNNSTGEIFMGGYTTSSNFPVSGNARQSTIGGTQCGFLQKLSSTGSIKWSSYFKSASSKSTSILCMEFNTLKSQLYFGGITNGLPASNKWLGGAYDSTFNSGTNDFFVCRMDTNQNFVSSTFIGGSSNEVNMMGLNTDLNNDVFVFGYTNSTNFPTSSTPNVPLQSSNLGSNDKVFFKLKSDLTSLIFSTYYGGNADDYDPVGERGIKFSNCRIYTIVTSTSNNIPLTQGALNTSRVSTTPYEPGLVVWANPPDLLGNTVSGNQVICAGTQPSGLSGSLPSYSLPTIIRNGTTSTYPSFPSAATYQWQQSTDSTNWTNISGATNQNITGAQIGILYSKTFFRRIIGGDACVLSGPADQVVTVKTVNVTSTTSNVSCFGFNNGSLTANALGTSPISYLWSTGATTQTISNLSPNTYSVTITDGTGCTANNSFNITQPQSALSITITSTNATCGNANGTATVSPSGGTPGYTYLWSNGSTVANPSGLVAANYSVTVKDANLCSLVTSVTVNQATTLDATIVPSDVSCFGGSNGSINLTPSGGTPTYHFVWSNGATTEDISGLTPNTYTVTITDANQCTKIKSTTVGQPSDISLSETHNDVSCNSGSNGSIDLTVTGGTAPYTYHWNNNATTQDLSGIAFGVYSVTVTDAHSCPKVLSNISIGQPTDISLSKTQVNNICFGGNTGSIDLSVSGGTAGYTYLWSNGATTQDISGLTAIAYTVTVTDAHSCTKTLSTTITEPAYIEITGTPAVACESYNLPWNQVVTVTNTYDHHYTSIHGCDSLVHIHVTINHGTHNSEIQTACESYSWHGVAHSLSGVYTYSYNNQSECPSVDTLHLTINHGTHNSSTQTACESYYWNGTSYSNSGTFTYPYENGDGCPSVDTLHLTINHGTHNSSTQTACESYYWNGTSYSNSGTFTYPYENGDGCPSVDTLHLTINHGTHNSSTQTACESYYWNGTSYSNSGTFTYPYENGDGCPSVDTLHLTINYGTHNSETHTACESYFWNGINYTVTGVFTHPYENGDGCPSVDTLHLTINYGTHNSETHTACESYFWNGINYTVTGVFTHPYENGDGCPSVDTLHLTINYGTHNSETHTACESYFWNGINYTVTGVFTHPYENGDGCPSVDTLHLTINYGTHNSETHTACESYFWNGINYTASGVFTHPYENGDGCPSVDTLHLTINYGTHNSETHTACESYFWNGNNYTVTGVFTHPYENGDGCPSVDTLHLTINYGTHNSETHTACESYFWNGINYTVSGVFTHPYENGDGCPSVDTLHLTINYGTHNSETHTACESYFWNGINYTVSGVFTHPYENGDGCPSVDTLHLTINYGTHNSETHTACESYFWNGNNYTVTGVFTHPYENGDGCPSVDTLHLTINYGTHNSETHTACESYFWNGINYTVTGVFTHPYENGDGCPSVDTLHLTINYGTHNSETHTACESYYWNGINYTVTGVFTHPYENGDGCPSVDTLYLTINYGTHNSETHTACETYNWNGVDYSSTGVFTYPYNNQDGCPSVDTLHLTITHGTNNAETHTACESYSWNGINYTVSGTYIHTYENQVECSSVDTLHLTINYGTHNSETHTACESYYWNGINYTVTGVFTHPYENGDGCPSVDTLHLTINYGTHNSETHTACESYYWNGINYTVTGVFTHPYENGDGCPSVDTLHLTINYGTHNSETHTACESYFWNGINYTVTGVFTHPYENQSGCPSVDTLHLTINYGTHNSETHTACESYYWNGINYTVTGVFTHPYENGDGCPSVDTLHLTINYGTHNSETHTACESYFWNGINYTVTGVFTHPYENQSGCPSVDTLHLTINYGTHNSETHTACESYFWNGINYTVTGVFTHPYENGDGCPSVDTLHLTINYGTHNSETHTACESYFWNGINYTVTGVFTHPYENGDGCPSVDTLHLTISPINLSAIIQNASCNGNENGWIDLSVSGGTAPYTYVWSNGATTQDISNLGAETFYVTVYDVNQCIATGNYNVTEPGSADAGDDDTICVGNSVQLTATGGNIYLWTPSTGLDNASVFNPIASPTVTTTYTVTISNSSGELVANGDFEAGNIGFTTDYIYVNTPYSGGYSSGTGLWPEGKYAVGPDPQFYHPLFFGSGYPSGTGNFMIVNGSITPGQKVWGEIVNVTPNTDYYFSAQISTLVPQSPAELQFSINGSLIGPTLIAPAGINDWVQFYAVWNSGSNTSADIKIVNGNTIASGNDFGLDDISFSTVCSVNDTVVVHVSNIQTDITATNVHCGDIESGAADLEVSGGINSYSYAWSNGETTQDITGIPSNFYSVTVSDGFGCTATDDVQIDNTPSLSLIETHTSPVCGLSNGSIDLTVVGGTSPFQYFWSNGATIQDISSLMAGTYSVTVYDVNQCSSSISVTLECTPPPACNIQIALICGQIFCNGDCNGTLSPYIVGGTAPFTYHWSNGETTSGITGLCSGIYGLTVTDVNGCTKTAYTFLQQPSAIIYSVVGTNTTTCEGSCNGSADLSVSGGVAPYIYAWSNGATTQDIGGLCEGIYTVTITDFNGCVKITSVEILCTPPPPPPCNMVVGLEGNNVTCFDACNGEITAIQIAGTAPFQYSWSNGATTASIQNLCPGTYCVTVTDAFGCTAENCKTITQPDLLIIVMDCVCPYHTIHCHGDCNGMANMTVFGGTAPYSYDWSNGATTQDIDNLCAGFYCVTVTDAHGCTREGCIMIEQPEEIEANAYAVDATICEGAACNGSAALNVTGGTPPYTYVWSDGETTSNISGLCSGTYEVTVTDANGCTKVKTASVGCIIPPPPPPPSCPAPLNFTVTNITSSTADLHWDAVPGAYGYKIRRRAVGTTNWVNTGVYAPAHHKVIQNLQCNTAYEWQIMTLCNAEQTDNSGWITNTPNFTTAPYCAMPTGLYVDNITSTSAIVHWNTVPNATSYRIRYRIHGTTLWTNVGAAASATQKIIHNLTPGATYDWQLRAKCAGSGDASAFSNSNIQHFTMLNGAREEDEDGNASVPMSIYPNPTQSDLTVTLNNGCNCNDGATITITNVLGQTVYSTIVNLSNGQLKQEIVLPASVIDGMYFVTVRSNNYVETRKLTVGNK